MLNINSITEDFVKANAANASALNNAKKISSSGGFRKLCKTADELLIFGDCYGSGSKPYSASVDFYSGSPIFRCTCPSRQIPCKHCLGIMFDWLAKKEFTVEETPEDIVSKRQKIEKRAENAEKKAAEPSKANQAATAKKLQKQREGLELADHFVKDIFSRGICSLNQASCEQYKSFAVQLGDYYLPEPQALVNQIIASAEMLSENPDDNETHAVIALCVRLAATIKKSMDYIDRKLESKEVMPEDNILYEEMGGVWKLSQLKELGLCRENCQLIQLAFTVANDEPHMSEIDLGYWMDLESGEIFCTKHICPYKALKRLKREDSAFERYAVSELYLYPGTLNRRVRWENAESCAVSEQDYAQILSKAEESISAAVKKAKIELKNTLSQPYVAVLIHFDTIAYTAEGQGVLKCGDETIGLRPSADFAQTCETLRLIAGNLSNSAAFGGLSYDADDHKFYFSPFSIVTENSIIRL